MLLRENPSELISGLFPAHTVTVFSDTLSGEAIEALYKEEAVFIKNCTEKRKNTFALGRICARKALSTIGIENFPILKGEGRSPIWPKGVAGSISHTKDCCVVAVARKHSKASTLGIDIEQANRLKKGLWPLTLVKEEQNWIEEQFEACERVSWSTLIFSAKEAFYKCQYPLTHQWLGFLDVSIEIDRTCGIFTVTFLKDPLKEAKFEGKYTFFGPYVATSVIHNLG